MKKFVKEIWLKFRDLNEFEENEERVLSLLDRAPGDCIVKAYIAASKESRTLDRCFDEKQISLLKGLFQDDEIKLWEKEVELIPHKPFRPKRKAIQIIPCNDDMYVVFGKDGKYRSKVLMYALCDDGEVYPMYFDSCFGVSLVSDSVYDVSGYEMEGGEIWQVEATDQCAGDIPQLLGEW